MSITNDFNADALRQVYNFLPYNEISRSRLVSKMFLNIIDSVEMKGLLLTSHLDKSVCLKDLSESVKKSDLSLQKIHQIIQYSYLYTRTPSYSNIRSLCTLSLLLPPPTNQKIYTLTQESCIELDSDNSTSPCSLGNGFFVIASESGNICLLKLDDKNKLIKCDERKIGKIHLSSPTALGKGFFVIGSLDKHIYLMHASEEGVLQECSTYKTGKKIHSSACVLGDNLFAIGSTDNSIYLIRVNESGLLEKCDSLATDDKIWSSPIPVGDGFFACGSLGGCIFLMKVTDKRKIELCSKYDIDRNIVDSPCSVGKGLFVFGTCSSDNEDENAICLIRFDDKGKFINGNVLGIMSHFRSSPCSLGNGYFAIADVKGNIYCMKIEEDKFKSIRMINLHDIDITVSSVCALGNNFFTISRRVTNPKTQPGILPVSEISVLHVSKKDGCQVVSKARVKGMINDSTPCAIGNGYFLVGSKGVKSGQIHLMKLEGSL